MANINQVITLGIGTPSGIPYSITWGLLEDPSFPIIPVDAHCTTFYADPRPKMILADPRPLLIAEKRPRKMVARCFRRIDMARHEYVLKAESDWEVLEISWEDWYDPATESRSNLIITVTPPGSLVVGEVSATEPSTKIFVSNGVQGASAEIAVQLVLDSGRKSTEYIDIFTV